MTMKRFWKHSTLTAAMAAMMTALLPCSGMTGALHAAEAPAARRITLTAAQRKMVDAGNDFACDLLRAVGTGQQSDGSIVMSPVSVSHMLGMLGRGAQGETLQQINDVAGLSGTPQDINAYFKKLVTQVPKADPLVTVTIAGSINVNKGLGYCIEPQYEADMLGYYNAQAQALDFTQPGSVNVINNWCKNSTHGMIPTALNKLDPSATMCLLGAVYFKAQWTDKFDARETRDRKFTLENGRTLQRKMMHRKSKAQYGENDLCKMLCLPYGNDGYSMHVLLPHEGKTVDAVINSLNAKTLKKQQNNMTTREVDILMPRFTVTSEINLNGVLAAMGMPLAFDEHAAEFPYMATWQDERTYLYVSMMKQKAKIEVDEEGTKAAAVTVTVMRNRSAAPSQGYTFHATRPFVYYIVENSTGTILFMGTYRGD